MSSGARRTGHRAVVVLVPVAVALSACGGGGSSGTAARSTTTSSRASSTTAGPSAPSRSTSTTLGSAPTRAGTTSSTSPGSGSTTTTAAAPTTIRIDASQNRRTVSVHVGDTVQIVLTGCGGCGYTWRMTGQPSPVVFTYEGQQTSTASTTSTSAGQPPVAGQPVDYVWTFKAVSAHTTGFIAQYFPPQQGASATQTFAVQLRVTA